MTDKRNLEILAFKKAHDWSYGLIAEKFGVTRNVVAGLMFRQRHDRSKLVSSPNGRGRNKTGKGYRGVGPYPKRFRIGTGEIRTVTG